MLLGISTFINTFCTIESECVSFTEISMAIHDIEELLGINCYAQSQEEELTVLGALKALKNIGPLVDTVSPSASTLIAACYNKETKNSIEVRIASIEAASVISCSSNIDKDKLLEGIQTILANDEEDFELRITAYKALISSPTTNTIVAVQTLLRSETINQVGSYIWSHLTSMKDIENSSPTKRYLKRLTEDPQLQNKWKTESIRSSRYFENYHNLSDSLDASFKADGSIIFSEDSYLPRSGSLNLSVNIFGENMNIFEIGARIQGLEPIIEDLFSPQGQFKEEALYKMMRSFRGIHEADVTKKDEKMIQGKNG